MELHKVQSSSIFLLGYDTKQHKMQVVFKNNATYKYDDVTKEQYKQILNADSPGTKLKEVVKGKTYTKL